MKLDFIPHTTHLQSKNSLTVPYHFYNLFHSKNALLDYKDMSVLMTLNSYRSMSTSISLGYKSLGCSIFTMTALFATIAPHTFQGKQMPSQMLCDFSLLNCFPTFLTFQYSYLCHSECENSFHFLSPSLNHAFLMI